MFKKSPSADWDMFVSVNTGTLICKSLPEIFHDLKSELNAMGATYHEESINRVDYAMDFSIPNFELDQQCFIAPARSKLRTHYGGKPKDTNEIETTWSGGKLESVTVGKMPGRQHIVYDKRRAAIDKRQYFWFKVWGIDPKDKSQSIWRVEVRAGKEHLKDCWNLRSFHDVECSIGDVFLAAMESVRYIDKHQSDSNVSRQTNHPLWQEATRHLASGLMTHTSGLTKDQMIECVRQEKAEMYYSQFQGLLAGYAVMSSDFEEDYSDLPDKISAQLRSVISNPKSEFNKAIGNVKRKYVVLDG